MKKLKNSSLFTQRGKNIVARVQICKINLKYRVLRQCNMKNILWRVQNIMSQLKFLLINHDKLRISLALQ